MTDDEQELRRRFALLRREQAARAPAFPDTVAAARARPRPRRLGVLTGAALAVAATLAVVLTVRMRHRPAIDLASVRVHTPTDFLLQLPGADLLRTVPSLTIHLTIHQKIPGRMLP